MNALLALEDGTVFRGISFGAPGERVGEAVFNTSMSGYQEVLTDPSYKEQIVTMTYPLIGNYGINDEDVESSRIQVSGFVVKEACKYPSNFRSSMSLGDYLKKEGIIGIEGIDTRALTRHIRSAGAMNACISTEDLDKDSLIRKAQEYPGLVGRDLVSSVTSEEIYSWNHKDTRKKYKVAAFDFGIKWNILRLLEDRKCDITVFPASASHDEVSSINPDGIFLSNGPGDPAAVSYVFNTVRKLSDSFPIFGICLGHQLLALAFGGKTYKLKFGHRGGNQPVIELASGKIDITSQNHGFCVDPDSLEGTGLNITHINCNDNTVEGLEHSNLPLFSVQYHPESAPGPHDAQYLFDKFISLMDKK
ncbi:glutamine-hydrolyzing carbamoyl-phosphate synthase small subunit [Planctomycetota bacterium]